MRKRLNTDELEDLLKDLIDGHKMYPSNKVWTNIQETLHGTTRWPALTFVSLFIITSLIIGTVFIRPDQKILSNISREAPMIARSNSIQPKNVLAENIAPDKITSRTIRHYDNSITSVPVNNNVAIAPDIISETKTTVEEQAPVITEPKKGTIEDAYVQTLRSSLSTDVVKVETVRNDEEILIEADQLVKTASAQLPNDVAAPQIVLPKEKRNKWQLNFYITPSGSFRRLVDDNKTKNINYFPAIPLENNAYIDVNDVVRHRPARGIEIGAGVGYKITPSLTINAGLQLNIRQYDIEAFAYSFEQAALELTNGVTIDTISRVTRYRNSNGNYPITLNNKYHEISAPIGIEWTKNISRKLSWGVVATIQPTYVFSKEPFVITTNYKNYTEGQTLLRNWNVNTSVETYISYQLGDYRWHVGPQLRYQQLPTFNNSYRIREFLYDYGVKIGFTKTLK